MVQLKEVYSECSSVPNCVFQFLMVQLKDNVDICYQFAYEVSIPNGSIKSPCFTAGLFNSQVSIPNGSIKRAFFNYSVTVSIRVSIPNGSIKSKFPERKYSVTRMFQFLMVQLKELHQLCVLRHIRSFNS